MTPTRRAPPSSRGPSARALRLLTLIQDQAPTPMDGPAIIEDKLRAALLLRWEILRCHVEDDNLVEADRIAESWSKFSTIFRTRLEVTNPAKIREDLDALSRQFSHVPTEDLERMLALPPAEAPPDAPQHP